MGKQACQELVIYSGIERKQFKTRSQFPKKQALFFIADDTAISGMYFDLQLLVKCLKLPKQTPRYFILQSVIRVICQALCNSKERLCSTQHPNTSPILQHTWFLLFHSFTAASLAVGLSCYAETPASSPHC